MGHIHNGKGAYGRLQERLDRFPTGAPPAEALFEILKRGVNVNDLGSTTEKTAREGITRLHECISAARDCPVPVIARING